MHLKLNNHTHPKSNELSLKKSLADSDNMACAMPKIPVATDCQMYICIQRYYYFGFNFSDNQKFIQIKAIFKDWTCYDR